MRLADDLAIAQALALMQGPNEVRREQMRRMVDKMFPQADEAARTKMMSDIDTWLEGTDELLPPPTSFGANLGDNI